jgi:hypothetical protein
MIPPNPGVHAQVVSMDTSPPAQVITGPQPLKRAARVNQANETTAMDDASGALRARPTAAPARRAPANLVANPPAVPTRAAAETTPQDGVPRGLLRNNSCNTVASVAGNGGSRNNGQPAPRSAPTTLGESVSPDLAPALGRIARVLHDERNAAAALRERLPGLSADQPFEGAGVVERDIARLTMQTPKSINPLHEDVKLPTLMFISPVTDREARHVDNPFMMPVGIKTSAALKKRDQLADFLLKIDYTFLTPDGALKPVTAEDVYENGHRSFDTVVDDGQLAGLYSIAVFPEYVEQLAEAFRKGLLGHFFCPGLPRDEPADAFHFSIAVEKNRGRTHIMQSEVIFELWHQHQVSSAYFISDPRAFKGQYVYMCTCVSQPHLDWCLSNSVTLLGDATYETFRHDPVPGPNIFFISGAMSVTDANLRIKPGLAGLLHLKATQLNFFKAADLISKNVVILRAETPDDAATVAQVNALMSRGILLSTSKPGKTTITYAPSHVGTPYKMASSLDELQKLVGHSIMRTTAPPSDSELGEEPESIRAAPGTVNPRLAELQAIVAAGPPVSETDRGTRRRRLSGAPPGSAPVPALAPAQAPRELAPALALPLASAPAPSAALGSAPAAALAPAPGLGGGAPVVVPPVAGTLVRIKRTVTEPTYGWGSVTHNSIGVFIGTDDVDGDWVVDFPRNKGWHGLSFEFEIINEDGLPPTAPQMPVNPAEAVQGMELVGEPVEEPEGGEGMLFILEHFFAFKRLARYWRTRRARQCLALAIPSTSHSPVTHGGATAPLFQSKMRTSEWSHGEAPEHLPTPTVTLGTAALGDARLERLRRGGACVTVRDGRGSTCKSLKAVPASQCEVGDGILLLGTDLLRDSALLLGRDYGTRLPPAAAQHEHRGGVLCREGDCVDVISPQHGPVCSYPQHRVHAGIQAPVAEPPYGDSSATLFHSGVGTARYHESGQQWRRELVSRRVVTWWGYSPFSLSWVRVTEWHA